MTRKGNARFPRRCLLCVVWLVLAVTCPAQSKSAAIRGKVVDPKGGSVPGAQVRLANPITNYSQSAVSSDAGEFQLVDIPFHLYTLTVEAAGFEPFVREVQVRSNLDQRVDVRLSVATVRQQVNVVSVGEMIDAEQTAPSVVIDSSRILDWPTPQPSRSTEEIVSSAPGWTLDANGRLHARGIEYQVQYSLDGIPITDTMAATFASSPDPRNFRSVEITTANIPAEYGNKLAGIIAVNTRSGLEIPTSGSVTLSGGSFSTFESSFDVGGHTRRFGYFLSAAGGASHRFLDPPALENFHNRGRGVKTFFHFDFTPTTRDLLRFTGSVDGARFDVPNLPNQQAAGQDQHRESADNLAGLSWQHSFSGDLQSYLAVYERYNSARLRSNTLSAPVFAEQSRHNTNFGAVGSLTYHAQRHTIKTGFDLLRFPLSESFTFAITDLAALLKREPDLPDPVRNFTLAHPFLFQARRAGWEVSSYFQDHFQAERNVTLDLGLRFDSYHFLVRKDFVSPRFGAAYYIPGMHTVLRASLNRFLETPALENLLLSSSEQARIFSPASDAGGTAAGAPVRPSLEWQADVGFQQQVTRHLRLDATFYFRWLVNPPEITNFLETGIIFPATLARSRSKGIETRLDLARLHGFSGFVSYTNLHIYGFAPITGGLFLGEAVDLLRRAGQRVKIEEDQRNTVVFELHYDQLPRGVWMAFGGRFDSGYSVELAPDVTRRDFVNEFSDRILDQVNFEQGFVRPHTVLNFYVGKRFPLNEHVSLSAQFNIQNLANTFHLITFESVFSGTTLGRPRTYSGRLTWHFQ